MTVPIVVVPSPQSIEALKSDAGAVVSVSVKVATVPVNEAPSVGEIGVPVTATTGGVTFTVSLASAQAVETGELFASPL